MARLVSEEAWAVLTIAQEASGESYAVKLATAEVIRNRMRRRYSSDGTVAGTVLRPYQFSGWNTKDPNRIRCAALEDTDPLTQECRRAWKEAVAGSDTVNGAVLYFNPAIVQTPEWVERSEAVAVVGPHHFFVPKEG
jgi:N-acetylmuramoyl-L-alanine amidase